MANSEQQPGHREVNTEGGAYVEGNANVTGDFVGRDKSTYSSTYNIHNHFYLVIGIPKVFNTGFKLLYLLAKVIFRFVASILAAIVAVFIASFVIDLTWFAIDWILSAVDKVTAIPIKIEITPGILLACFFLMLAIYFRRVSSRGRFVWSLAFADQSNRQKLSPIVQDYRAAANNVAIWLVGWLMSWIFIIVFMGLFWDFLIFDAKATVYVWKLLLNLFRF